MPYSEVFHLLQMPYARIGDLFCNAFFQHLLTVGPEVASYCSDSSREELWSITDCWRWLNRRISNWPSRKYSAPLRES